ncbi:MAG: hypothetical protein DCC49_01410 [Acidobacteria bacterium]|nr:MAG: hypothetical protein DCC49_01410 [Acidobacteriota bacterium]
MNYRPRFHLAPGAALAVGALALLLFATSACAQKTRAPTESTSAQSVRFVETDGWWSIEIPGNWQAVRIELDGDRTLIDDWAVPPSPNSRPMRDQNSTGVTYEFHEGAPCRQCTVTDRARITVSARPLTDVRALEHEISMSLQGAPGISDFTTRTFACDGLECVAFAYVSQGVWLGNELRPSIGQQRVYELRTAVPVQRFNDLDPVFRHSLASFRTEPRS